MNKLTRFLLPLLFTGAVAVGVTSCSSDETEPAAPAELNLNSATLAVTNTGGRQKVPYTLKNPVEGTSVALSLQGSASWITNLKDSANTVVFDVAENPDQVQRSATINVAYGQDIQKTIKVTQAANPSAFEASVSDVTKLSADISIIPNDDATEYLILPVSKEEAAGLGDTPEAIAESYLQALQEIAESNQVSVYDLLSQSGLIATGSVKETFYGYPGTEYNAYIFGISKDATVSTPVSVLNFKLNSVNKISAKLGLTKPVVDGTKATFSVTPENKNQLYFCYFMTKESYYSYANPVQEVINSLAQSNGLTPADVVNVTNGMGYTGDLNDVYFKNMQANTEYVIFAAAVDKDGAVISDPETQTITTGAPAQSTNKITLSLTNITSTSAQVIVKTTNDDPYAMLVYGDLTNVSDEDVLADLAKTATAYGAIYNGDLTAADNAVFKDLTPGTKYTLVAAGMDGGVATTKLVRLNFTTSGAAASVRVQRGLKTAEKLSHIRQRTVRTRVLKSMPLTLNQLSRLVKIK